MRFLKTQLCAVIVAGVMGLCLAQDTPTDFPVGPMAPQTCDTMQCPPKATCVQLATYAYCDCPYGKTGMNCEMDDPCLPTEVGCPPGAQCFGECGPNIVCNGANGLAQCAGCVQGWTAQDCSTDVDECVDMPGICLNGGQCRNLPGDYACNCPSGWVGKDCFCKKGTQCDVEDVKDRDQYSDRTDSFINPTFPDDNNNQPTGDNNNSNDNNNNNNKNTATGFSLNIGLFVASVALVLNL